MNDMKVRDAMTRMVVTLSPGDSIHEAAARLATNGISGAPVVEDGTVTGMVSESDIVYALMPSQERKLGLSVLDFLVHLGRRVPHGGEGIRVADVMSPVVIGISPDESIWEAASTMHRRGVKRLPVTDPEERLVGIISRADVVRMMARDDSLIADGVKDAIGILGADAFEKLEIDVREGMVSLRGKADRMSTKTMATRIAERVPGVVEVRDDLAYAFDEGKDFAVQLEPNDLEELNPWSERGRTG